MDRTDNIKTNPASPISDNEAKLRAEVLHKTAQITELSKQLENYERRVTEMDCKIKHAFVTIDNYEDERRALIDSVNKLEGENAAYLKIIRMLLDGVTPSDKVASARTK